MLVFHVFIGLILVLYEAKQLKNVDKEVDICCWHQFIPALFYRRGGKGHNQNHFVYPCVSVMEKYQTHTTSDDEESASTIDNQVEKNGKQLTLNHDNTNDVDGDDDREGNDDAIPKISAESESKDDPQQEIMKKDQITVTSKYFASGDNENARTRNKMAEEQSEPDNKNMKFDNGGALPKKTVESKRDSQQDCLISSQNSETLDYSMETSLNGLYTNYDFESGSDYDELQEEYNVVKKKRQSSAASETAATIDISEDSSEDESVSPWKKQEKDGSKGKLRQTTLPFLKTSSKNKKRKLQETCPSNSNNRRKLRYSDMDTEQYRLGYPVKREDNNLKNNLLFYTGEMKSIPRGDFIDKIHEKWFGDYELLERHHGYIQWLFPIREDGMNWHAQALQLHEAKAIESLPKVKARVLMSYELMLDFYGMKLLDNKTGQIGRSRYWKRRFDNLSWSSHNYLRITRILKSLGELGYEHLKKPLLQFILEEVLVKKTLTRLLRSCEDFWIGTIKNDQDRDELHQFIEDKK